MRAKTIKLGSFVVLPLMSNPLLLYGKVNPSVLIGSFLVGISPYGPFLWKRS